MGIVAPWLPAMGLLVCLSAFFSGSEAAFFSLQANDRRKLADGTSAGRSIDLLLRNPEHLLSAVLLWNLVINMVYFGIASIVGKRLEAAGLENQAIGFAVASLLAIIFFSEMLPKSIAVQNPVTCSLLTVRPLHIAIGLIDPILPMLRGANLLARRIIWPNFQPEKELEIEDLDRAIEMSAEDTALADRERQMLRGLVAFANVRVDELMMPRSQYQLTQHPISDATLQNAMRTSGYIFLSAQGSDEIKGTIAVRWLRPSQMDDLQSASEPPLIVPWSTSIAVVFEQLREENRHVAAIVNEYGETIGVLSINKILRTMLSSVPTRLSNQPDTVEPLIVRGQTSARDLARMLDVVPPNGKNVTVAGLMQSINRRFPRVGDHCVWNNHRLEVVKEFERGKVEISVTEVEEDARQ